MTEQSDFRRFAKRSPLSERPPARPSRATVADLAAIHGRVCVDIPAEARQGTNPWRRVAVTQLSCATLVIAGLGKVDPDIPLRLRVPGLQLLSVTITGMTGAGVECALVAPLHTAVFDHIRQQYASA